MMHLNKNLPLATLKPAGRSPIRGCTYASLRTYCAAQIRIGLLVLHHAALAAVCAECSHVCWVVFHFPLLSIVLIPGSGSKGTILSCERSARGPLFGSASTRVAPLGTRPSSHWQARHIRCWLSHGSPLHQIRVSTPDWSEGAYSMFGKATRSSNGATCRCTACTEYQNHLQTSAGALIMHWRGHLRIEGGGHCDLRRCKSIRRRRCRI